MDIRLYQLVDHRIKGNPAIRLYCYFRGKYYTLPTGIRLPSKYWDKAKQKVKPTYPLHFEYNRFLSNFVNLVTKKTLDFLATNPKPTHHQFKEFWKQMFQSLFWWILLLNSSPNNWLYFVIGVFQSLFWWILLLNTIQCF